MPKIVFGARRLRFEAQQVTGKQISIREAAEGITTKMEGLSEDPTGSVKMTRNRLSNYELVLVLETKNIELLGIAAYYGELIQRPVEIGEIMRIDPNNKKASIRRSRKPLLV